MITLSRQSKGIYILILSGALFGAAPLICYYATVLGSNYDSFLIIRSFVAAAVIFLFLKPFGIPRTMPARSLRDGVFGSMLNALCTLMLTLSYKYIDGGIATTIHFIYPACVMAISCAFFRARVNLLKVLGLVFGISGVALFSGGYGELSLTGVMLSLGAGLAYGLYIIVLEHSAMYALHPLQIGVLSNLAIGFVTLIYSCVVRTFDISGYSVYTWLYCAVPVFIFSLIAAPLFQIGVRYTNGMTGSLLGTTEPIAAVILGCLFMDESITVYKLVGCALIIASVIFVINGEHEDAAADKSCHQ